MRSDRIGDLRLLASNDALRTKVGALLDEVEELRGIVDNMEVM